MGNKTNFARIEIWKKYCKKKNLSKNRKLMLTLQVLQECQSRQYTHEVIQQHLIKCQEKVDTLVGPDFQYVQNKNGQEDPYIDCSKLFTVYRKFALL